MKCPKCWTPLEQISGDYSTGVSSNGYHETTHEEGYYCERCNTVFDTDDLGIVEDEEICVDIDSVLEGIGAR